MFHVKYTNNNAGNFINVMSVYCLANSGKSIKTMGPKVALSTMYLHRKISTAY